MLDRVVTMAHPSSGSDWCEHFLVSTHQESRSGSSLFQGDPVFSSGCTTCSQELHKPLVSHSEPPGHVQSHQDIKTGQTLQAFSRWDPLSVPADPTPQEWDGREAALPVTAASSLYPQAALAGPSVPREPTAFHADQDRLATPPQAQSPAACGVRRTQPSRGAQVGPLGALLSESHGPQWLLASTGKMAAPGSPPNSPVP